ncbi:hypothetical protein [Erwinia sp. B116]|uniref:hypothetical protein n=1 Tax=Erwinia sp. B116 TaxID=1561024 RepID=UPI0013043706|nr:hypothetical protein [Erwinia sp. B116]
MSNAYQIMDRKACANHDITHPHNLPVGLPPSLNLFTALTLAGNNRETNLSRLFREMNV